LAPVNQLKNLHCLVGIPKKVNFLFYPSYSTFLFQLEKHKATTMPPEPAMPNSENFISIVVPAFNEEEVLPEFHRRTAAVLDTLLFEGEIVYINDGSSDGTLETLKKIQTSDMRVVIVDLSRNYGKEIALTAGLDFAKGNAVVPIDADLQDPPELIEKLVEKWLEGYDVVLARRMFRAGESWLKKSTAGAFYHLMDQLGGKVRVPANVGDFRLLDRKAINALNQMREYHRFMKGLFATIGFRQTTVDYIRDERFAGKSKWDYWNLWKFSLEGITSFTIAPLKFSTYLGLLTAVIAFIYGIFIFGKSLVFGDPVPGFPSLMVMVALLGGMQLTVLGVIGEYLGRVFNETKNRPLYFVQDLIEPPQK